MDSSPPPNVKVLGKEVGLRIVDHLQEACRPLPFHSRQAALAYLVTLIVPSYVGSV